MDIYRIIWHVPVGDGEFASAVVESTHDYRDAKAAFEEHCERHPERIYELRVMLDHCIEKRGPQGIKQG